VAALRELTRDKRRFSLIFEENMDYGFRRNCLGLRPFAIAVASVVLVSSAILIAAAEPGRFVLAAISGAVALLFWTHFVTADWVKLAADRYADRLFDGLTLLER
jgi:hypothetical protein